MNRQNKYLTCLVAALITTVLAIIMYLIEGIYPGSSKTILVYDEATQYCAIWQYMRYIVSGQESFFLNWSIGLGGNNLCQMAYYLGSPINAIVAFFPIDSMPEVLYWLTISKYALASFSFACYCCYFRKDTIKKIYIVIFSMCYGLMSYMVIYSMSLMWLDVVILLPIIIGSLERIQYSSKYFIISLTIAFYVNFYIGYMIVIFSVLYLIWLFFYEKFDVKKVKEIVCKYIISGLLAFGFSSPLLIPTALGLIDGKGQEDNLYSNLFTNDVFSILCKSFSCQYDTIRTQGTPNFFVGTLVLLLCLCFFISKSVKIKAKLCSICIIIFFVISFWFVPINNLWHGLRAPICFPGRYSFCLSFFILILAIEGVKIFDGFSINNKHLKKYYLLIKCLFCAISIIEMWANGSFVLGVMRGECTKITREELDENYIMTTEAINSIIDYEFFRIDTDNPLTHNDPMLYGYNGLSYFSSIYNYKMNAFLKSVGALQYNYILRGEGVLPGIREILMNKYFYSSEEQNIPGFDIIQNTDNMFLYLNSNIISFGEFIDSQNVNYCAKEDIFENINYVVSSFADNCELYKNNRINEFEKEYDGDVIIHLSIEANSNGPLYLYFTGESSTEKKERQDKKNQEDEFVIDHAIIKYEDKEVVTVYISDGTYPVYICDASAGESICIDIESNYDCGNFYSATFQQEGYDRFISRTNSKLENVEINKSTVTCSGDFSENGTLFFSIPYSDNFKVYIDGEKVSTSSLFDAFLCCDVEAGMHSIVIKYIPKGLFAGIIVFVCTIVMLSLYLLFVKKIYKNASCI